jgi:hypothetical protein
MLSLTRETQVDKAKDAVRDAVSYADEVLRDERLRADLRAAIGHGTRAGERVRKDIDAGSITTRLAADKKLRKNLRALLDDLDSAGERVRRRSSHRFRNFVLFIAGAAAVVAAIAGIRQFFTQQTPEFERDSTSNVPVV